MWGKDAKLLKQTEGIKLDPTLDELAIFDAVNANALDMDRSAGRPEPKEGAQMSAVGAEPIRDGFTRVEDFFERDFEIRKRLQHGSDLDPNPFRTIMIAAGQLTH